MGTIRIAGVCERDIDLLLLEEFYSSLSFRSWFLSMTRTDGGASYQLVGVERSVQHSQGESDLEVLFDCGNSHHTLFLVENKIGAAFQPKQAERYRERGRSRVENGTCSEFKTVIFAPQRYLGASSTCKFDIQLSHESLRDWFKAHAPLGDRRWYKVALLNAAIEKGTLGYQPVEDAPVSNFWQRYWKLASQVAPELQMPAPGNKPAKAGFIRFEPEGLPKGIDLVHKLRFGRVDLQFRGMGSSTFRIRTMFGAAMMSDFGIAKAAKSAAIRVNVPKLNTERRFDDQVQAATDGIKAAQTLHSWFLKNRACWLKTS